MKRKPVEIIFNNNFPDYNNQSVSFKIDPQALIDIDNFIEQGLYKNRSEFFRNAIYQTIVTIKSKK